MKLRRLPRKGMVLPLTLSVIFVIGAFVFAMYRFQSHRVWVTGVTVNDITALAAAEAGLACALAEVRASRNFATHEITSISPQGVAEWGTPISGWTPQVQPGGGAEQRQRRLDQGRAGQPQRRAHPHGDLQLAAHPLDQVPVAPQLRHDHQRVGPAPVGIGGDELARPRQGVGHLVAARGGADHVQALGRVDRLGLVSLTSVLRLPSRGRGQQKTLRKR